MVTKAGTERQIDITAYRAALPQLKNEISMYTEGITLYWNLEHNSM